MLFLAAYLALRPPGSPQNGHPRILDPFSIALFAVGIASMVYHATLRQGPQFGDDLSMLFLGGSLLQTLYSRGQTRTTTTLVTTVTAVGTLGASAMYIRSGNIFHHFAAFSTMVHLIWPRTLYLILSAERPQTERTALLRGFWKAAALLVAAFVLWNIDLEICFELRELRARIGLPWVWLLELHGWWYVLTTPWCCRAKLTVEL